MKARLEMLTAGQFVTMTFIAAIAYDIVGDPAYRVLALLAAAGAVYCLYKAWMAERRGMAEHPTSSAPREEA